MFNLNLQRMNVKNLMLLLAFTGLAVSCSEDIENNNTPTITGRSEIQIEMSGTSESQEYTKAIASESENEIDKLQVYLFAAKKQGGPYYYLETWTEGTAYNPVTPTVTNFQKQASGTGWKASIYPNELIGLPYVKLFCVVNNGSSSTTNGKFYQVDGATEVFDGANLVKVVTDADGEVTTPGTTEADFVKTYTKIMKNEAGDAGVKDIISTPLLMTGEGQTKISGSVSKVNITLRRAMARFDIDNTTSKSRLTIKNISLGHARKTGTLWPLSTTLSAVGDKDADLMTYAPVPFSGPTANNGVKESALYVYPALSSDECYLIIEGTYKSPVTLEDVPVTYNVPIQKSNADGTPAYIDIKANSRYQLSITDVTQASIYGSFEVVDWTSGGGINVKPSNDAPVFDVATGFEATTGNIPVAIGDSETAFTVEESSVFKTTIAATGKVRAEKSAAETKTASPEWLQIADPEYKEVDGVWYSTFEMTVDKATGELPVNVVFINEAASYDPDLWTTLTFYGPKAKPTLATGGDGSTGNTVDYDTFKANMYNVVGSYIKVKAMCIEGTKLVLPENGEFEQEGETVTEGYYSTFTIKIAKVLTDGNDYAIKFQNNEEASAETTLTVTAVAAGLSATLENNSTYATISNSDATTYKVETDIDLLSTNTYNLKITAPEGLTANIPSGKWLTVDGETVSNGVTSYTVKATAGATDFTDFDITFTNKLNTSEVLTVTMHKAASKPKFEAATAGAKSDFNEAPTIADYASTASMYKANGSKIAIKVTCPETMTFLEQTTSGLTITDKGSGNYEIEVNNATALTGATTEVIAQNTATGAESRNAILTITWLDPAITFEKTLDTANAGTIDGDNINVIGSTFKDSYGTIKVKVKGYKGSAITISDVTSTWAGVANSPAAIGEDGTAEITLSAATAANADATNDITITVTNAITNGGDKTITLKKQ